MTYLSYNARNALVFCSYWAARIPISGVTYCQSLMRLVFVILRLSHSFPIHSLFSTHRFSKWYVMIVINFLNDIGNLFRYFRHKPVHGSGWTYARVRTTFPPKMGELAHHEETGSIPYFNKEFFLNLISNTIDSWILHSLLSPSQST